MKKSIIISIIMFMIIALLGGVVNAASAGISASSSKVTIGDTVKVTVSFGDTVSAVKFNLTYDTSKFEYVSNSLSDAEYNPGGKFAFAKTKPTASSVQFTFKAKTAGSVNFSIAGLNYKTDPKAKEPTTPTVSKSSVSIAAEKKEEPKPTPDPTPTPTPKPDPKPDPKPNTNTTKPTNNTNTTKNTVNNTTKNTVNETKNEVSNEVVTNEINSNEIDNNQIGSENEIASTDTTQEKNGSVLNYVIYGIIAVLAVAIMVAIIIVIRKRNQKTK